MKTKYTHQNNSYEIVSKIGYLIGIEKKYFFNSNVLIYDIFIQLEKCKSARVVRNMCRIRTIIYKYLKNSLHISDSLKHYALNIIKNLENDEFDILHTAWSLADYSFYFQNNIDKYIENCKYYFPLWIKWEYIKGLFVLNENEYNKYWKKNIEFYCMNIKKYPYQMFLNIQINTNGNILYNDEKFLHFLYETNGEKFFEKDRVVKVSDYTINKVNSFILQNKKNVVIVDCENANPYFLIYVLRYLIKKYYNRILKVILYNDNHTSVTWKTFDQYVEIPIEHKMSERVKENKSLVDIELSVGVCREFFINKIDSFILVSSDSDYWALIQSMPECKFLILIDYNKSSALTVNTMKKNKIPYCYINDFGLSGIDTIQTEVILYEINRIKKRDNKEYSSVDMLYEALTNTHIVFTDQELAEFKRRYIK